MKRIRGEGRRDEVDEKRGREEEKKRRKGEERGSPTLMTEEGISAEAK